jgi:predicted GNAT family acetyltransferase
VSFNQLLVDQPQPEIAGSAVILDEAHVGAGAILAQGLVVRAHGAAVSIGNYSAILENWVVIGDRLVLIHIEVPFELEGRGIGGRLVTAAVDRAAREGLTLVPLCPFARGWLERHPEAASRAVIDWDS